MSFCSSAGRGDELLRRFGALTIAKDGDMKVSTTTLMTLDGTSGSGKIPDISTNLHGEKDLSMIIMAMRKLREGIVASKRIDDFSIQAYIFCIRLSILVKNMESYHPAILYLLRRMHLVQPLPKVELQEFVGYLILDLACRQGDLAQAFAIRRQYKLRDLKVDKVLSALTHDNYFVFWKVKRSVDGHKAKLMEFVEDRVRIQALKCLGRTYFNVDLEYLEYTTGKEWTLLVAEDRVGWELQGKNVIIRKPKAK